MSCYGLFVELRGWSFEAFVAWQRETLVRELLAEPGARPGERVSAMSRLLERDGLRARRVDAQSSFYGDDPARPNPPRCAARSTGSPGSPGSRRRSRSRSS